MDDPEAGQNEADLAAGMEEASRLVEDGDPEGALQLLLELEKDNPRDATLLCMVGVIAGHLGAEGMAVDFFRRSLAENPTDPALLVRAGAGLAAAGDPEAEPALRLAAVTAPTYAPGRRHYGALLVRSGLFDHGLAELNAARTLDPEDADTHRELGIALFLAGRVPEAVEELETAVSLDGSEPEGRLLLGLVLLQQGESDRAAEEMHAVSAELEDDAEIQVLMALVFAAVGWMDEAWLAVSRAEAAPDPADPAVVREVEDALESGEEAARSLLETELAPSALRTRLYRP